MTNLFEHYKQTEGFGHNDGFAIAVGIIQWDDGAEVVEEPAYGELKFFIKSWGDNAPYSDSIYELDTEFC